MTEPECDHEWRETAFTDRYVDEYAPTVCAHCGAHKTEKEPS